MVKRLSNQGSGKQCAIILRDDKTRMTSKYYLRRKSEALEGLEQFLAYVRGVCIPENIRSDDADNERMELPVTSVEKSASCGSSLPLIRHTSTLV